MFDWLTGWVSASPVSYLIIAGITIADIVGVLPAETVITAAVVLAVDGRLLIVGVGAAAFVGAVAGDNVLYPLGRRVGVPLVGWMFRGERAQERLDWAVRQMREHGNTVIVAGRFIPMGRTATMFAAGFVGIDWRQFIVADVTVVTLWTLYWVSTTAILGEALSTNPWVSPLVSLGVAGVVAVGAELVRRRKERRRLQAEASNPGGHPRRPTEVGASSRAEEDIRQTQARHGSSGRG